MTNEEHARISETLESAMILTSLGAQSEHTLESVMFKRVTDLLSKLQAWLDDAKATKSGGAVT